jgi:hypothetical protein
LRDRLLEAEKTAIDKQRDVDEAQEKKKKKRRRPHLRLGRPVSQDGEEEAPEPKVDRTLLCSVECSALHRGQMDSMEHRTPL